MSKSVKKCAAATAALSVMSAALLTGCGGDSGGGSGEAGNSSGKKAVRMDKKIHDSLPKKIKDAGRMTVVMNGSSLPYWKSTPGKEGQYTGVGAELMQALGQVMGVKVNHVAIPDISAAVASVSSKRYAFAFAPYGDSVGGENERPGVEFVDVVQEVVPFLVEKGNPKKVNGLDELCGIKLAAQVNGGAYERAVEQAKKCKSKGKPKLDIVGVTGVPNGILAVRSKRADAFFSSGAPLFHAEAQSGGKLEVVGEEAANGFDGLFQGAVLPKDSELTQPVLKGFEKLFADGTYERIMKKAGLEREILDKPGVNLYSKWLAKHEG